jgi:hypothetical protein
MKPIIVTTILALAACSTVTAQEVSIGTYLHGTWTITGTSGEEEVTGTMRVSPASAGLSQIYRWTVKSADGVKEGSAIGGIDPESGKIVEHGFGEDFYWKNTYEETLGDNVGRTTGKRIGMLRGERYEGNITVDRKSKDLFHFDVESDDGDDVHFVFTRG